MIGLHKIRVCPQRKRLPPIGGSAGAGHDHYTDMCPLGDGLDPSQELFAIPLRQIEIKEHDGGRPSALLMGGLVDIVHGVIAIVDDLELVGKLMSLEHPLDEVDV